jgi:hypothetical protein
MFSLIAAPPNGEIEMVAPAFPVVATATQSEIVVTVRSVSAFAQVVRRDPGAEVIGHRRSAFLDMRMLSMLRAIATTDMAIVAQSSALIGFLKL